MPETHSMSSHFSQQSYSCQKVEGIQESGLKMHVGQQCTAV